MKVAIVLMRTDEKNTVKEMISAVEKSDWEDTELWVFGEPKRFTEEHVKRIIYIQDDGLMIAERFLPVLKELMAERQPDVVLFSGGYLGDDLAIRLGCALEGSCASAITDIGLNNNGLFIRRRVFGYHIEGEFWYNKAPYIFSVSKASFAPTETEGKPIIQNSSLVMADINYFENYVEESETLTTGLDTHNMVLCGGRGLGSRVAVGRLEKLGDLMGAGVGATRPIVLNAWLPMNKLIGMSGAVIKPKILITFGVSGCAPFIKGVEKSQFLVAINNDENAIIFKHCDIGIVGDCNEAIEELLKTFGQI